MAGGNGADVFGFSAEDDLGLRDRSDAITNFPASFRNAARLRTGFFSGRSAPPASRQTLHLPNWPKGCPTCQ